MKQSSSVISQQLGEAGIVPAGRATEKYTVVWQWEPWVHPAHRVSQSSACASACCPGADERMVDQHGGRPIVSLSWVAQQPRPTGHAALADYEADELADLASAYAQRCEHILGPCDRTASLGGMVIGGLDGPADHGAASKRGFAMLQVCEA